MFLHRRWIVAAGFDPTIGARQGEDDAAGVARRWGGGVAAAAAVEAIDKSVG